MRIAVVGAGYVGLVTGACFSEVGNYVVCVDINAEKIAGLRQGRIPIYEPGLEEIVKKNVASGRLDFSVSLADAVLNVDLVFIAVGTPSCVDGSVDLSYVREAAAQVGKNINKNVVVVNKSTVPVGTADEVKAIISSQLEARGLVFDFDVVSNPEFLKEGAAIGDFMSPDRVIVGTESVSAREVMRALYAPFIRNHDRFLFMGVRDAEMTKYVANCMLATRISFMNEVAILCEKLGVDVESVRVGIGSDPRIGYSFIYPGCGYGGSCFPKDVRGLIHIGKAVDIEMSILRSVDQCNENQKYELVKKLVRHLGEDLSGQKIAIWGLAFKPETDDVREAPALTVVSEIVARGGSVVAYDPVAKESFARELRLDVGVEYVDSPYDALNDAAALILLTEWKVFRSPDFAKISQLMKGRLVLDGRNILDDKQASANNLVLEGIGRIYADIN